MRRIRLQSSARLPSFRVWFLIPQHVADVPSLKLVICTQLPALKGLDISPAQLILEIDDFELIDECDIDLVRDGDILVVKARESPGVDTLKRKANLEKVAGSPKRRRLSISSEDSGSSSYTSDSSSSDSSSDSSSLSSSSDSGAEDSKLPPSYKVSNNTHPNSKGIPHAIRQQAASVVVTGGTQQPTVPPGLGKASTHSRNKRRKLKRKSATAQPSAQEEILTQSTGDPLPYGNAAVLESSTQPSGQRPFSATVSITAHASIENAKKSKGFTKNGKCAVPPKVVSDSSSVMIPSGPTFIPPSEREDLPKNLLVTSVEIDWRTNRGRTIREHPRSEPVQPDDTQPAPAQDPSPHQLTNWAAIETEWDTYTTLNASVELLPGTVIAWKAFGLDPITLTPQASMLYLGKIVSVDLKNVQVQPLKRPDSGHAAFGRASMGEDQEPAEEISQPLHEIWTNDWKLISHQ
ncbi:hypothetical protein JB92DRAFT_2909916 [Gautieria morchelliformis]|nr:hypothetical protein JB92DRAFT_2909916 [Gautieria morchelliformis]